MSKKTTIKNKLTFNELPKKVSIKNFNQYIKQHLSKGTRGPETKISSYKTFNYILYVLHTGIQWQQLKTYKNELSWQRVYAKHSQWSKDGSYEKLFKASVIHLKDSKQLDLSVIHGDGSNAVIKKGVKASDIQVTNIKKVKKS